MIRADVDTSNLETAIAEFAHLTRKDLVATTLQQSGMLVGHVIAITPPGHGGASSDSGGISLAAKKSGESRIAADIAKIFPTTRLPEGQIDALIAARHEWDGPNGAKLMTFRLANSLGEMAIIHKEARNPRSGRTRAMGGRFTALVRPALLKQFIRQESAKVGLLNRGWLNAARELKTASRNVPAWIKRHGESGGGCDINDRGGKIGIRIFNTQTWFPQGMEGRVAIAVSRREAGLRKALAAILERRAQAAEKRMNR